MQLACWVQEQQANPDAWVPALHESLEDVRRWLGKWTVLVLRREGRLVGAARGRLDDPITWDVGRLMVAPDLQGQGLGRLLLEAIEAAAPPDATSYVLFTGAGSLDNQRMYKKAGYRLRPDLRAPEGAVILTKPRRRDTP
ncbi:GNAT family N-acetyltransferase [Nocardioides gansuensis]|uniref:GNAT family N-acetyltransferase n=1 Tax=Nocardioides gansuensis TaxID=2138300 RepID=UPI002481BA6A|nr:GNAT family N-acetyltransferase [Nocardioides gansuensis]